MRVAPWRMVAVGDGSLVHIVAEEFRRLVDGLVQGRITDAGLAGEHERDGHGQTDLVHAAVAFGMAVGQGGGVAPHAVHALVFHAAHGGLFQLGKNRLLAGGERVFAEEEISVGDVPVPCVRGLQGFRDFFGILAEHGVMLLVAAGEQGEGVEVIRDVGLFKALLRDQAAALLEDGLRLRAIVRRRRAVGSEHLQLEFHVRGFSIPPEHQGKDAGFLLGGGDRVAETPARVVRERLAEHAENHVVDPQDAIGGRTFVHRRDEDLPGCGGEVFMAEIHPAAQPGGAEQPVVGCVRFSAWVKSGIGGLSSARSGERNPPRITAMRSRFRIKSRSVMQASRSGQSSWRIC